jgi:hypothetical protein
MSTTSSAAVIFSPAVKTGLIVFSVIICRTTVSPLPASNKWRVTEHVVPVRDSFLQTPLSGGKANPLWH